MMGPNFMDEIDCGSFFDHIDDLLDFPSEDVDAAALPSSTAAVNCDSSSFPSVWPADSDSLPCSDLSAHLPVPYEDFVQLEWLSNFVEDSFTAGGSLTMKKMEQSQSQSQSCVTKSNDSAHTQFQTSSPVSVLESSSSCSGEKPVAAPPQSPPEMVVPAPCGGRARSKRPRPATFKPRPAMQLISPASSVGENTIQRNSDCENFVESHPVVIKIPKQSSGENNIKKKKKIKFTGPLGPTDMNQQNGSSQQAVRKCMHCEITKTPQWRAGPMGPKTLCNACGVRYKSGRLFPEYRPAASPTFCPSLHSNSHKKVLEMRGKTPLSDDSSPELIPNTNCSLTLEYM